MKKQPFHMLRISISLPLPFPSAKQFLLLSAVTATAVMLLTSAPAPAEAAVLAVNATSKAAFDRTVAAASTSSAARMNVLYRDYAALTVKLDERKGRAEELHLRSSQMASAIRKGVTSIDTDRIARQEAAVKRAKAVYEPIYTAYTAITHQASAASKYGNKETAKRLRMQADTMKAGVQLARQQIRVQEEQLKAVRAERTRKINAVRKTLGGMDEIALSIRSRQLAARTPESAAADCLKEFAAAARKNDTVLVEKSLEMMTSYANQLLSHRQALVELEQRSSTVVLQAQSQLAANGVTVKL